MAGIVAGSPSTEWSSEDPRAHTSPESAGSARLGWRARGRELVARAGQRLLNSRLTGPAPRRLPVAREFTAAVESLTGTELVGWVEVPRRTGPVESVCI